MSNGYFDIVNTSIASSFSNATNFDLAISTDNVNQQILLGNGSNIQAGITLNNNHVTLLNQPRYTPAYCAIYPSVTKSYTATLFDYVTFSSSTISDPTFYSINIDPTISSNNTVKLLKSGTYSVYFQVTTSTATFLRMGYSANYALASWSNIPFAPSNNGTGLFACAAASASGLNTINFYDVSTFSSNTVLRFLLECDTGPQTILNYATGPYNGTSKMIITLVG